MSTLIFNQAFSLDTRPKNSNELKNYAINNNTPNDFILILPTGKQKRYFSFNFIRSYFEKHKKPISKLKVFTFDEFAEYIFKNSFPNLNYKIISQNYQYSIIEEILKEYTFNFYKSEIINPSVIRKITNTILSLKSEGFTSSELNDELKNTQKKTDTSHSEITDVNKYQDIIDIFGYYETYIKNEIYDKFKILAEVTNSLQDSKSFQDFIPENTIILFDGFNQFKSLEINFLKTFSTLKYPTLINFNNIESNKSLSHNINITKDKLFDHKFNIYSDYQNSTNSILNHFKKNLFNPDFTDNKIDLSELITIVEVNNKHEEVARIAKLIKYLVLGENQQYAPSDIIISTRTPESYSESFREIFEKEGIPINISERYNLSNSNIIILLLNLIELFSFSFNSKLFIKVLTNPIFKKSELLNNIDTQNIIFSIQNLKSRNIYTIERLIKRIKNESNNIQKILKNNILDQNEINKFNKLSDNYNKAIKDINKFYKLIEQPNQFLNAKIFTTYINNIIDKFKLLYLIRHKETDNQKYDKYIEKDTRAIREFLNVLDEYQYIQDKISKNRQFDIQDHFKKFKSIISETKYQIRELFEYGVTFTSIEQTRGIDKKVSILCGATQSEMPLKFKTDKFLGKELPSSEEIHNSAEKYLFFLFLINGSEYYESEIKSKQIFIFYPNSSDGNKIIKSSFIDNLNNIAITTQLDKANSYWFNLITNNEEIISLAAANKLIPNSDFQTSTIKQKELLKNQKTGILTDNFLSNDAKNYLNALKENKFSTSKFDRYVKQPYEYFTNYILKLNQSEQIEEDLNPLEKGNLLHKIMYSFFTTLQIEQKPIQLGKPINTDLTQILPVTLDPSKEEKYLTLLRDISNQEILAYKRENPLVELDIDKLTGKNSIISNILKLELERIKLFGFKPALFEFEFGLKSNSPIESIELENGIKINGKIDRIDIKENNGQLEFLLIDYKLNLNKGMTESSIIKGESFQFPIYSMVIKKIFSDYYQIESDIISAIYYSFNPSINSKGKSSYMNFLMSSPLYFDKEFFKTNAGFNCSGKLTAKELEEDTLEHSTDILNRITSGQFPYNPPAYKPKEYLSEKELKYFIR